MRERCGCRKARRHNVASWNSSQPAMASNRQPCYFFILSGFVIAKAYERKLLSNMRFSDFALVRIARLYPLLIAAAFRRV